LVIFVFSSIPYIDSGLVYDYPLRKSAHMAEFGTLFLLARRALNRTYGSAMSWTWAAAAFSIFYAMSDEWHQTFVPGRTGRMTDVAIDSGGVALAALGVWTRGALTKASREGHP